MKNKRAIVTGYTPNIAAEVIPFVDNQAAYATRWGYDYVVQTGQHPKAAHLHPSYSKIYFLIDLLLAGYETVVWADADVAFTNFSRDIGALLRDDDWVAGLQEIGKGMPKYLCCGLLVFRNGPEALYCLRHIAAWMEAGQCGTEHPWEQTLFNRYTHEVLAASTFAGIRACLPNEIGSFWPELLSSPVLRPWQYGDLTIHCGIAPWDVRARVFVAKFAHKVIHEPLTILDSGKPIPEPVESLTDDDLKGINLFIAVPCHGGTISVITAGSLLKLTTTLTDHHISHTVRLLNGETVARARNKLADEFMDSDCNRFLQLDSDIGFRHNDILDMLRANVHVIGGVYPKKCYNFKKLVDAAMDNGDPELETVSEKALEYVVTPERIRVTDATGRVRQASQMFRKCLAVNEVGTGLLLVSREALQRFRDGFPRLNYADDFGDTKDKRITCFFNYDIVDDRYLSEDYWFCAYWRKLGGKVWAWPWARLDHDGHHVFEGQFDRRVRPTAEKVKAIAQQQPQ